MLPLVFVILCALAVLAWLIGRPLLIAHRRRRIAAAPFPDAWRVILRRRVPLFRRLPADLQLQLKRHIQVFLAEKTFIGCNGVIVDDDMRITIAAHACLLILNRPTEFYPDLRQILVYPSAFLVDQEHRDEAGVLHRERNALAGESWSQGQVILSWEDVLDGAAVDDDGFNVAIHEFAHQLDMETGDANGAPLLDDYAEWAAVLGDAYEALQQQIEEEGDILMDDYGATDPAEFFAVASEVFFEEPLRLRTQAAPLYDALSRFYRVDPAGW